MKFTYNIKIRFVTNSKHLSPEDFAVTDFDGISNFTVYVRNNPSWIESLAHEFGHVFCGIANNLCDFTDESFPRELEDLIVKKTREMIDKEREAK